MNLRKRLLLGVSALTLSFGSCTDPDVTPALDTSPKGNDEIVQVEFMHFGDNGLTIIGHSDKDSSATGLATDEIRLFLAPENGGLPYNAAVIIENYKRITGDSAEANGWIVSRAGARGLLETDTGNSGKPVTVGGIRFNGKFAVSGNTNAVRQSTLWNRQYSQEQFNSFRKPENSIGDKNYHLLPVFVNGLLTSRTSTRGDGSKKPERTRNP